MAHELFAGIPVSDYTRALPWYTSLLGAPPTFLAHATEAVWELAEHRYLYVVEQPDRAGHALLTMFVDDLDAEIDRIAARGLQPVTRETYDNGVRKVTFRDADGNEVGFGGGPVEA